MAPSNSHLNHLKDIFSPFGEITIRKMFGGAGLYCDGLIFAIADDDDVWLKVDDVSRAIFEEAGLKPFEVEMNGKTGTMSYYRPPDEIHNDDGALKNWTQLALEAAARNKKRKSARPQIRTPEKAARTDPAV